MVEHVVAARDAAEHLGSIIGALLIPALGLVLLIVGLRKKSSSGQHTPPSMGYPGTPYQVPGQQYPGQPYPVPGYPQAAPAQGGTGFIVAGSILLVLGLLGVLGTALRGAGGNSDIASQGLAVGKCITAAEHATRSMDPTPTSCNSPDAVYELASRGDGSATCPDGKREHSKYAVVTNDSLTYCFAANLKEGHCYHADTASGEIEPVDCTDPSANTKVAHRFDGSTDTTQCGDGITAIAYPLPPRVFCMVPPITQ